MAHPNCGFVIVPDQAGINMGFTSTDIVFLYFITQRFMP
jgi:hypothetical protein